MKVLFLDGSPKAKDSASAYLLGKLEERLGDGVKATWMNARKPDMAAFLAEAQGADALVVAFPLYVDGLPSHLLRFLEQVCQGLAETAPGPRLYVILNNGFYESRQNRPAMDAMRLFCMRAGLVWGQAIGVGAGPMVEASPPGYGPMKNLGRALDRLAENIQKGKTGKDCFVEPNFPRVLYRRMGNVLWRRLGRKNGIKPAALRARPAEGKRE